MQKRMSLFVQIQWVKLINLLQFKFVKDSIWTLISYIILAVSGILANVIIGNAYGAAGLGVFSQSLAIYMILSLIGVFGLNISVLKHIAHHNAETDIQKSIFTTASVMALAISLILTLLILVFANHFPTSFFNTEVTKATSIMVYSLPFFVQNKIFTALANGMRQMKIYSLVQSARWILIIGFILVSFFLNKSVYYLSFCFLFSEVLIFLFFIIFYYNYFTINKLQKSWYKKNLVFGSKSVLLGFVNEANNRIDIFFISFFLTNQYVGIYSFASSFIKGFLSLAAVVQLNINPIISDLWKKNDLDAIRKYTQRVSQTMLIIITPMILLMALAYPIFIYIFMSEKVYLQYLPVFYILLSGVFLRAVYSFAGAYLSMADLLNVSLKNLILVLSFNAVSCFILIHFFGFYGAALSTASTYVFSVLLMHYFIKKRMGIALLTFKITRHTQ